MLALDIRRLQARADRKESRSAIEPLAVPAYGIVAFQLVAAAVLLPITGFTLSPAMLLALPVWAPLLCLGAALLRRYDRPRISGWLEATGLIYVQGLSTLFLLFPLTALSAPFADAQLAAADRALGFDWPGFAHWVADDRFATNCAVFAYNSFGWQPFLVIGGLFAARLEVRAWQAVTAAGVAALATALIYPFAPALGAYVHFGLKGSEFARFGAGFEFPPVLIAIKEQGVRTLTLSMFSGFVSFPSYHAAAAVIFTWAMWPFHKARYLFLVLNCGMMVAATVGGGHYVVDIVAGAVVAAGSILCARLICGPAANFAVPRPGSGGKPAVSAR